MRIYHKAIIFSIVCADMGAKIRKVLLTMNAKIEKRVGRNIRTLRERAGLTQDLLAAKLQLAGCDVTRSAIAKIEVGQRHLYPDEILLWKELLGVSFEEIFDMTDEGING